MFSDDKSIESIQQLFLELKKYLILQKEYTKLELTEKLAILFSTFIIVLFTSILSMMALFYFSFMLVYFLAPMVGSIIASFALIAGLHILLIILLFTFKQSLVINPTVKFLTGLFLKKPNTSTDNNHEQ